LRYSLRNCCVIVDVRFELQLK